MVGTKVEQAGIIRHGAKMLYAVSSATVPKLTVVLRKGYGAGYYVMNGRAYEPDALLAWPGAEISVMGAEGMVAIAAQKMLAQAEDPKVLKAQLAAAIRPHIDIYRVAAQAAVDDVDRSARDPARARALLDVDRGQAGGAALSQAGDRAGLTDPEARLALRWTLAHSLAPGGLEARF